MTNKLKFETFSLLPQVLELEHDMSFSQCIHLFIKHWSEIDI